jgi:hypothetical protein
MLWGTKHVYNIGNVCVLQFIQKKYFDLYVFIHGIIII